MTINQVIAHLKMLKFINYPHESTIHAYKNTYNKYFITVIISKKRMRINSSKIPINGYKTVRTNHKQGLQYLAKFLYNLKQE